MNAPSLSSGMYAWDGFCGDAIRLRNRRLLVLTLCVALPGASFIWIHPHLGDVDYWWAYWRSAFGMPDAAYGDYFLESRHRSQAEILMFISGLFLLGAIRPGRRYLRRRWNFLHHPFARKLAIKGTIEQVAAEIDLQYAAGHQRFAKGAYTLTADWLIFEDFWTVDAMRHADLVWVFNCATSMNSWAVVILDRFGDYKNESSLTFEGGKRFRERMMKSAPQAVHGWDREVEELWNLTADKSGFPQIVRSRYPNRATTNDRGTLEARTWERDFD